MKITEVILVDEKDRVLGKAEKMEAHRKGLLHRAFSVFIFNSQGEMLLQQRAAGKYHSGGLWSNACCSHPAPGEETIDAAHRRLMEEMGFDVPLEKIFEFVYKTEVENDLVEYEFDHVFAGEYDGEVHFNREEVKDYCCKSLREIAGSLQKEPQQFTEWFQLAFPRVQRWWNHRHKNKVTLGD